MANTQSAKKAFRRTERRTKINRWRLSVCKTHLRNVESMILEKDQEKAYQSLAKAVPQMARAAQKGIFHKKKMSRTISRITRRIHAINLAK